MSRKCLVFFTFFLTETFSNHPLYNINLPNRFIHFIIREGVNKKIKLFFKGEKTCRIYFWKNFDKFKFFLSQNRMFRNLLFCIFFPPDFHARLRRAAKKIFFFNGQAPPSELNGRLKKNIVYFQIATK